MNVSRGFSNAERDRIAILYWEAFGRKLGRLLGPRDRALAYISAALSPDHAFCARDAAGNVLGVAGFKTARGALVASGFSRLWGSYGLVGAAWRLAALTALSSDTDNRRFLVDGLFVDPACRGRGIGTRLLEALVQEAAARGHDEVRLDVIDGNPRARALYERRGFRAAGRTGTGAVMRILGLEATTIMVRRLR